MSVSVADLLNLPSLREAKVVAGASGLSRIVASISVLEYCDTGSLQDEFFQSNEFFGNEIAITGFTNVKDDVSVQCNNIRKMASAGEVGLILYYVGIFLQSVDQALIDLANELSFPLICMPENRMDLRYSEVICEVMEAIFKDQMNETSFVSQLLERIARLPPYQRTVDTALKMLSDRIRCSVVLTDASGNVLNEAAWPRNRGDSLCADLKQMQFPLQPDPMHYPYAPNCLLYHSPIKARWDHDMSLMLIKEGEPLSADLKHQATEFIQLAVSIWSQRHSEVVVTELVRAILQDEPMKMRRLADIFRIDVASVNTMWIVKLSDPNNTETADAMIQICRNVLTEHSKILIVDQYEGDVIILTDGNGTVQEKEVLAQELYAQSLEAGFEITLTTCANLENTAMVRTAFLANTNYLEDVKKVYPNRSIFQLNEILFVRGCRDVIEQGELAVKESLSVLAAFNRAEDKELRKTLAVYALDANFSVSKTAQTLFLHKNAIKYRLCRISDRLGFRVDEMPGAIKLYQAVALDRLLE